jgi:5-methylcytosine-specific restriction endonuclease McrA
VFLTAFEGRCPVCLSTLRGGARPFVHYDTAAPAVPRPGKTKGKDRRRRVRALLARDGDLCWLCSKPLDGDATLDHVVPRSKGGKNGLENLRLAHKGCNGARGNADAAQM